MKIVRTLLLILLLILAFCLFTSEAKAQGSSEQDSFKLSPRQHLELVAYAGMGAPSLVNDFQPDEFGYVRKHKVYAAYKGDVQKVKYGRRWGLFGRPTWWVDGQRITINPNEGSELDLFEREKRLFLIHKGEDWIMIHWWWDNKKGTTYFFPPGSEGKGIPVP